MDQAGNTMDETCAGLMRLSGWLASRRTPTLPFVGRASGHFFNPPAPHLEIVYITGGEVRDLRIGKLPCRLEPGQVSVHRVHEGNYSSPQAVADSWCLFVEVGGASEFRGLRGKPIGVYDPARLAQAFATLALRCGQLGVQKPAYLHGPYAFTAAPARQPPRPGELMVQAALLELLAVLLDQARYPAPAQPGRRAVDEVLNFVSRHYGDPAISGGDLAQAVHLSPDHLGRLFRAQVGRSPMNYLQHYRIQQACLLLAHTAMSVKQVAYEVGFTDPLHFSRRFSQHTRTSPSQYRAGRSSRR
jgi:AraC-like DNA-binding protein